MYKNYCDFLTGFSCPRAFLDCKSAETISGLCGLSVVQEKGVTCLLTVSHRVM